MNYSTPTMRSANRLAYLIDNNAPPLLVCREFALLRKRLVEEVGEKRIQQGKASLEMPFPMERAPCFG